MVTSQPSTSGTQQPQGAESAEVSSPVLDEDLFNVYGLTTNWQLAPELVAWIQSICNREIPVEILKELNEEFVPKEDLLPLFVAPALPSAINKKLFTAPKAQTRIPRIINSSLLRAQKELCVSYKPLIEVLNFFYSEPFNFIIESVPEIAEEFSRLKHLLSQGLAVLMSAGLKISKARKHSLRPLLNYYASSSILDQQPTSAHVLGSADLASISDKATKERKALSGVFRQAANNRPRFRTTYNKYKTSYNRFKDHKYSQSQDYNKKPFFKSRAKNRSRSRPNKNPDK